MSSEENPDNIDQEDEREEGSDELQQSEEDDNYTKTILNHIKKCFRIT